MLDESRPNYLCSIYVDGGGSAVCFCDLSTGEISVTEFPAGGISHMINEIASYSPAEAVLNSGSAENAPLISFFKNRLQCLIQTEDSLFVPDTCRVLTESQFKGSDSVTLLSPHGICAVGALLGYMNDTQKTDLSHISVSYTHLDVYKRQQQGLVGLGKSQLPWKPRAIYRVFGRCSCTSVKARDKDYLRSRLCNACSYCTHAGLRHQLYVYCRLFVCAL